MVLGTLLGCYWVRVAYRAFLETFATTVVVKDAHKDVTTLSVTGNRRVPKVSAFSRAAGGSKDLRNLQPLGPVTACPQLTTGAVLMAPRSQVGTRSLITRFSKPFAEARHLLSKQNGLALKMAPEGSKLEGRINQTDSLPRS